MKPTGSLIVVALLLGSGFAFAQDAAMSARPKAPPGAKVMIVSPQDGATVGQDVTVKFGVEGIALKPAGDPTPDSGHHHLLIDAAELPPLDAPIPVDATHKHYGRRRPKTRSIFRPARTRCSSISATPRTVSSIRRSCRRRSRFTWSSVRLFPSPACSVSLSRL
jgi:hypothetical protein